MTMARRIVDGLTIAAGRLRRGRRARIGEGVVKANLGCGLAIAPGWLNIDGSFNALIASGPRLLHHLAFRFSGARQYYEEARYCGLLRENRFFHYDLSYGVPLDDEAADFLYTSHFVEHLAPRQAARLLADCFRVLKPGGVLRVSVPDLEYAVSLYGAGQKERMLDSYFFVDDLESGYARHKYMYDFELLCASLRGAGFPEVRRRAYREGEVPDLELLDNRPEESLFVEARKA